MGVNFILFTYFILSLYVGSYATVAEDLPFHFSFNFTKTYRSEDLIFEETAGPHGKLVDLTCNSFSQEIQGCKGRMSYAHPVPFYDNKTGQVASFNTNFTFAILIDENTMNNKGDGMAFFISRFPSTIPTNSGGGNLGLVDNQTRPAYGHGGIVAVEFDTYNNSWDPQESFDHIGIDINSVESVNTTILPSFSLNGTMTASVTFDNTTRMLVASLVTQLIHLDGNISLKQYEVSTQLPDPVSSLLPPEVAVGFSAATGSSTELHQIMSWSFDSSLAHQSNDKGYIKSADRHKKAVVTGGLIGGTLVLVLLVWFMLSCWKWTRMRKELDKKLSGIELFQYRDLAAATNQFSDTQKLGEGAFGVVYKGFHKESNRDIAVKKIKSSGKMKDFFNEVRVINDTRHKNLVKLLGCCCNAYSRRNIVDMMCSFCRRKQQDEVFLVYELVNNRNLDYHLHHKQDKVLSWPKRYKIAKGIASALHYLHHECDPYILHRDIKPGNILLDDNFNAKLCDFGLSRIAKPGNATLMTTAIGTHGYLDPQYIRYGSVRFNRSSDVYSFGIVLLEIACTGKSRDEIWGLYRERRDVTKAADKRLQSGDDFDRSEIERVIVLGLWCSMINVNNRPSMRKAMDVLEGEELPDLNIIVQSTSASTDQYEFCASAAKKV
uniref:non-specific serine/threonine protein kinase n=1 Tax=Leersia perrieri TaxID=77586 RepID=A0A0D9W218_9ORYZ